MQQGPMWRLVRPGKPSFVAGLMRCPARVADGTRQELSDPSVGRRDSTGTLRAGLVFYGDRGAPVRRHVFRPVWDRACTAAGLEDLLELLHTRTRAE
jgi:hypothetical protein